MKLSGKLIWNNNLRQKYFEILIKNYIPDLYRYAFWLSRDSMLAEDVLQESMLKAWNFFGSINDDKVIKSWLFTIVRNENNRMFKPKRIQSIDINTINKNTEAKMVTTVNTDVADLRNALYKLEDKYSEPLVLNIILGFSAKEISTHMNLKINAIYTRLFSARERLHTELIHEISTSKSIVAG